MNIPWWTCPSCFVSHPDKTASTESGASLLQAPDSRLHILGEPKQHFQNWIFVARSWYKTLSNASIHCCQNKIIILFLLFCSQYKFTCSPAPSLPSLLPELILLLSPWTRSVRQVSSHFRFCPDCTMYILLSIHLHLSPNIILFLFQTLRHI